MVRRRVVGLAVGGAGAVGELRGSQIARACGGVRARPDAAGEDAVKIGRELPKVACRDLGPIKGSRASSDWAAADPKEEDTYGQLTSSTRGLGGDHALIRAVAKDARGITVTATAYDCSGQAPPPQAQTEVPQPVKPVKVGRILPHGECRELGMIWGTGAGRAQH